MDRSDVQDRAILPGRANPAVLNRGEPPPPKRPIVVEK